MNFKNECFDCPYGCTTCHTLDLTRPYDFIMCDTCDTDFLKTDDFFCVPSYFYDI